MSQKPKFKKRTAPKINKEKMIYAFVKRTSIYLKINVLKFLIVPNFPSLIQNQKNAYAMITTF